MFFKRIIFSEFEQQLQNFNKMQNKRRRNKSSKFIPNLHKILNDRESGAFWRQDGKSFVLSDMSKIISNSLPKHFRHSNISSFIRQLNLYGFKKLIGEDIQENTYYHQKFKKNLITQLKPIRSFYNQQKYGSLKKVRKAQIGLQSLSSIKQSQQDQHIVKIDGFSDSELEFEEYKAKVQILEKQNQRLQAVEQQHFHLLSAIGALPGGNQFISQYKMIPFNNINPFYGVFGGNSSTNQRIGVNYQYNYANYLQNSEFNLQNSQNAYYFPFSNFQ